MKKGRKNVQLKRKKKRYGRKKRIRYVKAII